MKSISFLINPISIKKKRIEAEALIQERFNPDQYKIFLHYSKSGDHLSLLAKEAVESQVEIIVAIGGDGTVQRVAKELIGTKSALAVVPIGSGNGFARHYRISMNLKTAFDQIKSGAIKIIDTLNLNGRVSLNIAGLGFEGVIAKKFARSNRRGFATYLWMVIREYFGYRPQFYNIKIDNIDHEIEAFSISLCNGSQWGNNLQIAPQASTEDGLMELVVIKKFPFFAGGVFAGRLFSGSIQEFSYASSYRCKRVVIESTMLQGHLDGEPVDFGKSLEGHVMPGSLKVLVPDI
jgi:diacylglycerol kinase (ATP)